MVEQLGDGRISLRGRAALVTGAGRRVGAAIARRLGAEGMRVAVHYHGSPGGAEATCAAIRSAGGEAFAVQADLHDRSQARRLVDGVVDRFGGLDLLVPSAANFDRIPFDALDDAAWDRAMRLNLEAPWWLSQRAAPALRAGRGAIVLITCTSATAPFRDHLPYVVSKGAAHALMRALALELAPQVRVNAVAPGTVLPPGDLSVEQVETLARHTLLGRIGSAGDVAEAVVYLASAPFVTGQQLVVDGGATVGGPMP
jgi:pteridine reductase